MAECREEGGVEVLQGAGTLGIWSPKVTWERSSIRNDGLLVGSPSISMPHAP